MLKGAYETVKDGGHVVIGMGSRILVPFKKPLFHYCGHGEPVDQHPFHFSFNTLKGMLAEAGFRMAYVNRYIDNDVMCMIGEKVADPAADIEWEGDDWQAVMGFFERWHKDTRLLRLRFIAAATQKAISLSIVVHPLPFRSEIFGAPVGRLKFSGQSDAEFSTDELQTAMERAKSDGAWLISCRLPQGHVPLRCCRSSVSG